MRRSIPVRKAEVLRQRLDRLVETFDASTITPDPLEVVLGFDEPRDQEVAGVIAAAFAYGRADIVVRNATFVVERMAPSPYRHLLEQHDAPEAASRFAGFSHRFHKTPELVALLDRLAAVIRTHGSIGNLFRSLYDPGDLDVGPSLARFVAAIIASVPAGRPEETAPLRYLLTSPDDGSACKRMNLFLRWMVRRTRPDLGIWTFVDPSKLVIPLDTHVHRISTFLGLNSRCSADWKSARLLTDRLAELDPSDPVRYDFAICRLGILDHCSRERRKENCEACLLRDVCRFPVV